MRKTLVTALAALMVVLFPGSAQAHHYGPYVLNSDNISHYVMWRDHTWGTQVFHNIRPGQYSARGATGIQVSFRSRIIYRSVATGTVYYSACGDWYAGHGHVWQGLAYMPVYDRSIQILDRHTYPYGIASVCG